MARAGGLLTVLLILSIAHGTVADSDSPREERLTYIGAGGAYGCGELLSGLGGGCFPIAPGEESVSVWVEDLTGRNVTIGVHFWPYLGEVTETQRFCNGADLAIPAGMAGVTVHLSGPLEGNIPPPRSCENDLGIATTGEIVVTFYRAPLT
jgi:hypothetical protein